MIASRAPRCTDEALAPYRSPPTRHHPPDERTHAMSKTVPLGRPFFVTVRARHIAAGCITKGDECVVARALDAAFPELAGQWRVGTGGAVLVPSETPAGKGLIGSPTLGEWTHDAEAHIRRF